MDVDSFNDIFEKACNNFEEMRDRSLVLSTYHLRTLSISSSNYNEDYYMRVQKESNKIVEDNFVAISDSSQLKYMTLKSQKNYISKVANSNNNLRQPHVVNIEPALNNTSPSSNNMFNIQLSYDIDQALDLELWNSNFQAISLHRSMEYLVSNVKNVKNSLIRIHKYILGKTINGDKANSVKDLKDVGKIA